MAKKRGNGEGTIYYSESKHKWVAQFYIDGDPVRKTKYGNTRKEAKEKMLKTQSDALNGWYVKKNNITLKEIIYKQLNMKLDNNIITERTYKRTKDSIDIIERKNKSLINTPIQKITKKQLENFFITITEYADSTISQIYQLIKRAFAFAQNENILTEKNPFNTNTLIKPKSSKDSPEVEALTVDEHKKLLSILTNEEKDNKYSLIILLMLCTGVRIGEALALKKEDIDFKTGYIYVHRTLTRNKKEEIILKNKTKTSDRNALANRHLKIDSTTKRILELQLEKNICNTYNLIFFDKSFVDPTNVNTFLYRINKKYKISEKLHNHMMRHTYATRQIEAGVSAKVVQKKLGHKKITTTLDTYASVFAKFEQSQDEKLNQYQFEQGLVVNL